MLTNTGTTARKLVACFTKLEVSMVKPAIPSMIATNTGITQPDFFRARPISGAIIPTGINRISPARNQ